MKITELGVYIMANGEKACIDDITDQLGFCVYGAFGEKAVLDCCDGRHRTVWMRDGIHCSNYEFNLIRKVEA